VSTVSTRDTVRNPPRHLLTETRACQFLTRETGGGDLILRTELPGPERTVLWAGDLTGQLIRRFNTTLPSFLLMASLPRLRSCLPLKTLTGRFVVLITISYLFNLWYLRYVTAFGPLATDCGRLNTTLPINTGGWLYPIHSQTS
jgi:hypothetical protein